MPLAGPHHLPGSDEDADDQKCRDVPGSGLADEIYCVVLASERDAGRVNPEGAQALREASEGVGHAVEEGVNESLGTSTYEITPPTIGIDIVLTRH